MKATEFGHAEARPAPLPDCSRPSCSGRMLDHICVVCGASDKPRLAGQPSWPTEEPTQQSAAPSHLETATPTEWIRPPAPQPRTPAGPTLGAGLVEVPVMAFRDPMAAIMENPMVAEEARFCSGCFTPVGRGDGIRPGAAQGRCHACGTPFTFVPQLRPGDVVGSQYEVFGCLSYGGQGWIHLAKDHHVNGRWVVLKGMIHTSSPEAAAAAIAEQRFLSEVRHPNIVEIINFVWHERAKTNYLVMEYLGGPTLRDIALHHYHRSNRALPDNQVIAYGLEILRAFGYLHSTGLLYCDLKPSNVLQVRDTIKLIDLGGMRRIGDMKSPMIHTAGFAAPELGTYGPSIASDIYAVGRTMAALSTDFETPSKADMNFTHTPNQSPYHRVLEWATHPDPVHRPRSADVMAYHLKKALAA